VGGGGAEGSGASLLTDPAVVAEFVETTGVDALAVAIGTAHGVYTETPKLDFPRLKAIAQETDVPLVLHGGSGAPDDDLRQAIELGVCKINVGTDIRRAFVSTIVEVGQDSTLDVREVLTPAKNKMKEVIRERIRVFGASHRLKGD
jgi:fructose/tagatose bisphosphate aldolase